MARIVCMCSFFYLDMDDPDVVINMQYTITRLYYSSNALVCLCESVIHLIGCPIRLNTNGVHCNTYINVLAEYMMST